MDNDSITWEALEYTHHKKSADWYWILGILSVAGVLIAIVLGNFLFAILIAAGAITVALYANKPPRRIPFSVSRRGVQIGNTIHPFNSLESFWIDNTRDESPRLLLTSRSTLSMRLIISLAGAPQDDIRNYLLTYVREEEQGESFVERVMELVRF